MLAWFDSSGRMKDQLVSIKSEGDSAADSFVAPFGRGVVVGFRETIFIEVATCDPGATEGIAATICTGAVPTTGGAYRPLEKIAVFPIFKLGIEMRLDWVEVLKFGGRKPMGSAALPVDVNALIVDVAFVGDGIRAAVLRSHWDQGNPVPGLDVLVASPDGGPAQVFAGTSGSVLGAWLGDCPRTESGELSLVPGCCPCLVTIGPRLFAFGVSGDGTRLVIQEAGAEGKWLPGIDVACVDAGSIGMPDAIATSDGLLLVSWLSLQKDGVWTPLICRVDPDRCFAETPLRLGPDFRRETWAGSRRGMAADRDGALVTWCGMVGGSHRLFLARVR
jgi:hypothetical protein